MCEIYTSIRESVRERPIIMTTTMVMSQHFAQANVLLTGG
jgi:hypothetical protein